MVQDISLFMYLCHLTENIDPESGGPAYSIPKLCESLGVRDNVIDLFSLGEKSIQTDAFRHSVFHSKYSPAKLGFSAAMLMRIVDIVRRSPPDLLHAHNLWQMPSIYPYLVNIRWGIPYVVSPRGALTEYSMNSGSKMKKLYWPIIQRPALEHATAIHATAISELDDIRRLGFRQPVAVIPNGIDIPSTVATAIGKKGVRTDKRVLLFLGRIHPEKGLMDLLIAWKKVEKFNQSWILKIVGPDVIGYRSTLEEFILSESISRVEILDAVYSDDKISLYESASVLVLPSPTENFGIVVAEALSFGVPVIANRGAPWELLNTHQCGWWIGTEINDLSYALEKILMLSSEQLHLMGARGRSLMRSSYSWKNISLMMEQFYEFVLNGGTKPSFVDVV